MADDAMSNLFPTIGRIFAVVILGYMLGRFKIITQQNASAVGVIAGQIALPALLLQNMATLDLSQINWRFMAGMLLARTLIFVGVFVITLIFTRPFDVGKPAILAIFCTQSNEFALGLPISKSLKCSYLTEIRLNIYKLLNQVHASRMACAWFLEITSMWLCMCACLCVCVFDCLCICLCVRIKIISSVIWILNL